MDPADLEDLLAAQAGVGVPVAAGAVVVAVVELLAERAAVPAVLDVAEQLDAELVRVELRRRAGQRAAVVVAIVDHLGRRQALPGHDRRVPVAGPAFVHDLGLGLRGEVIGLVANDREHVGLPGVERRVLQQEQQHIALRPLGKRLRLAALVFQLLGGRGQLVARVDERIHVVLGAESRRALRLVLVLFAVEVVAALLVAAANERRVDVDQVLQAQAGVDELLDLLDADFVHVPPDAIAVVGHLVHHLAAGLAEPEIVLEEVAVAVDVGHHQLLVDQAVVRHQVGVARVVVDHHLVDLLQTVVITLAEPLVLHAEPPVRIADREAALGGDRVELVGVDVFEDRGEEIEAMAARIVLHLALHRDELRRQVGGFDGGHGRDVGRVCPSISTDTSDRLRCLRGGFHLEAGRGQVADHVVQPGQLACHLRGGRAESLRRHRGLSGWISQCPTRTR